MQLRYWTETLRLATTFRISRSARDTADVVVVELAVNGTSGYGEAAPQDRYGESVDSTSRFLDIAAELIGDDPFAFEAVERSLSEAPREMAARSALDAALHDLCGKLSGQPSWRLQGFDRAGPPTSWTIWLGDPDDMARRAENVEGFKRLKLKLGGRDGLDIERVRAVREATALPLMIDVNEYWEFEEALENVAHVERLGVEYVEQPLPAGDPDGAKLRARSALPIFLDEDCHTLPDVPACAERGHGINIKLAKSGGIREAIRMAHAARALGLGLMLGCMLESGLGIAAGCVVAGLCDYVDLDGNLLLAEDPWRGVTLEDGVQLPSSDPGLGVRRLDLGSASSG